MPFKDYYLILGVPVEESQPGIRARYLDLVKQLHPDVAGQESTAAFQEVAEAYDVLSDPLLRRRYNRDLRLQEPGAVPVRAAPASRERAGAGALFRDPVYLHDFETVHPSLEALFERILRNFTSLDVPKSEHLEPLDFEVVLTPEEAARGGTVPIGIPVFRTCPACRGSGRDWLFACSHCAGGGVGADERVIEVRIPPVRQAPAVLEVPLHSLGIRNLYLRLRLRVGGF